MSAATPSAVGASIAVTGMGAVSSLGLGCEALWRGIEAGRDGMRPLVRFSTAELSAHLAATVPGREASPGDWRLHVEYGVAAAREARAQAGLTGTDVPAERVALVLGTGIVHEERAPHALTDAIADAIGACGPRVTVATACSSSTAALGLGCDLLATGRADAVIAGGVDVINELMFAGFDALGALSAGKCAPFSEPSGTTVGEGAGFLVLETGRRADARQAAALGFLLGYGLSADGFAETAPDPRGAGVARAIASALASAGLAPADVGYVNAHATGTVANDATEWLALRRVFGGHAEALAVSATKSILGHAQGAAGVLEAIATLLAMRRHVFLPTLHFAGARPGAPADPIGQDRPRPGAYAIALKTSSAFGGSNAAVLMGLAPPSRSVAPLCRPVYVAGAGTVGAHGLELAALSTAVAARRRLGARVEPFDLRRVVHGASTHGLEPSSRFLVAAAARALAEAGFRLRGAQRERAGLVLGVCTVPPAVAAELQQSVDVRGMSGISPRAFSRLILNGPAGACSRALQLLGLHSVLSTGQSSGLVAVAYGAELLASRADADLVIAGGLRELDPAEASAGDGEGAACLALVAGAGPAATRAQPHRRVRLAGWGLAGPFQLGDAVDQALCGAEVAADQVQCVFGPPEPGGVAELPAARRALTRVDPAAALGDTGAASGALAAAMAADAVRRGALERALVVSEGSSAACAVVLVGELSPAAVDETRGHADRPFNSPRPTGAEP